MTKTVVGYKWVLITKEKKNECTTRKERCCKSIVNNNIGKKCLDISTCTPAYDSIVYTYHANADAKTDDSCV